MTEQRLRELKVIAEDLHRRQNGVGQPGAMMLEMHVYIDELHGTIADLRTPQICQPERE